MCVVKKHYNIEFIRFIFAVSIVYFHLLHSAMIPYIGNSDLYSVLAAQSKYTKYIVECFFIISGYFLYQTIIKNPQRSTRDFIVSRISRLWPVLACSIILSIFINGKSVYASLVDLFFLQSSGLATDWKGLNWYVSAFFVVEVFYYALYKCFYNSSKMKLLICVLIYLGYELNINFTDGEFGRKMAYGMINLGLARAVAGIGLGYMLADGWKILSEKWNENISSQKSTQLTNTIIVSFIEIITFAMLMIDFYFGNKAYDNQFIVVLLFPIFFICLLTRQGIFSFVTDHRWSGVVGKYAYSVYVMQEVSFGILQKTFWKNTGYLEQYPVNSIVISIIISFGIGILTYHLVEKPFGKLMKNRFAFLMDLPKR